MLLALAWGAFVVLAFAGGLLADRDVVGAALFLAGGLLLLVPLALPLLLLRSRWYRIAAFSCALIAALLDVALALAGAGYLLPSALLVLLSVLPPQPR